MSPIGVRPQAASANAAAIEKTALRTLASLVIAKKLLKESRVRREGDHGTERLRRESTRSALGSAREAATARGRV
jgi:hypothetical protein